MGNFGMPELILILVVVFLLFGAKKIPEVARGLGRGIFEFKRAMRDGAEGLIPPESAKQTEEPKKVVESKADANKKVEE